MLGNSKISRSPGVEVYSTSNAAVRMDRGEIVYTKIVYKRPIRSLVILLSRLIKAGLATGIIIRGLNRIQVLNLN